jgi:hypothetical protein
MTFSVYPLEPPPRAPISMSVTFSVDGCANTQHTSAFERRALAGHTTAGDHEVAARSGAVCRVTFTSLFQISVDRPRISNLHGRLSERTGMLRFGRTQVKAARRAGPELPTERRNSRDDCHRSRLHDAAASALEIYGSPRRAIAPLQPRAPARSEILPGTLSSAVMASSKGRIGSRCTVSISD